MINYSFKIKLSLIIISILILFSYLIFFNQPAASEKTQVETNSLEEIKNIIEGNENADIEVLVFESLTCPHCATFHKEIYPNLKIDFIDKNLVKVQFKSFPLDIVALNASKIAHCKNDGKSDILHFLYNNQSMWLKGETVDQLNANLEDILNKEDFGIDFDKCINNEIRLQTFNTKSKKAKKNNIMNSLSKKFEKKISEIKNKDIRDSLSQLLGVAKND